MKKKRQKTLQGFRLAVGREAEVTSTLRSMLLPCCLKALTFYPVVKSTIKKSDKANCQRNWEKLALVKDVNVPIGVYQERKGSQKQLDCFVFFVLIGLT